MLLQSMLLKQLILTVSLR